MSALVPHAGADSNARRARARQALRVLTDRAEAS